MQLEKRFNRLIIDRFDKSVILAHDSNIRDVVYNNYSIETLYRIDNKGEVDIAKDTLYESVFDEIYREYNDSTDMGKEFKKAYSPWDNEYNTYVKANWEDYEHYRELESEHGIRTEHYYIPEVYEILKGICFVADSHIRGEYPHTCTKYFYKFVDDNGEAYFVREDCPTFSDEYDYEYHLISRDEFNKYDTDI